MASDFPAVLTGGKLITRLPAGKWELARFGDSIIATCPDHPPRFIRFQEDGSIVVDVMTVEPTIGMAIVQPESPAEPD